MHNLDCWESLLDWSMGNSGMITLVRNFSIQTANLHRHSCLGVYNLWCAQDRRTGPDCLLKLCSNLLGNSLVS